MRVSLKQKQRGDSVASASNRRAPRNILGKQLEGEGNKRTNQKRVGGGVPTLVELE